MVFYQQQLYKINKFHMVIRKFYCSSAVLIQNIYIKKNTLIYTFKFQNQIVHVRQLTITWKGKRANRKLCYTGQKKTT